MSAQYVVIEMRSEAPHGVYGPFDSEAAAEQWAEQQGIGTGALDWFDTLPIELPFSHDTSGK